MKNVKAARRLLLRVVLKLMFSAAVLGLLWVLFSAAFQRPELPRLAPLWLDLSELSAGELKIVQWQQHRVMILHRTARMSARLQANRPRLKQADVTREQGAYSVLLAVGERSCPVRYRAAEGDFVDLCDGSRYDLAGRVFKDQAAAVDLSVPLYRLEKGGIMLGVAIQ